MLWHLLWSLTSACQKGKDLWPIDLLYAYKCKYCGDILFYTLAILYIYTIRTQNHNQRPWRRILTLEVILERIPGEAWGLCWHRTAFDEERQVMFLFPVNDWPRHGGSECQTMLNNECQKTLKIILSIMHNIIRYITVCI